MEGDERGLSLNDDEIRMYGADPLVDRVETVRRVRQGEDMDPDALIAVQFMPAGLLDWYARLVDDGLKIERTGRGEDTRMAGVGKKRPERMWPVSSGAPNAGVSRQGQVRRSAASDPIGSEQAIVYRDKVDRRLRKLARDIKAWYSSGAVSANRICAGKCHKIGDGDWNFCPRCGGPMREMDA